ncbi:hypothetical protein KFE25_004399 [Diacronema lutheri]|uniref:non-specific serine/threonine protein kinase n=1 Tax=Diacronema lutheri TaxID=2081491 RepID=A0A8J5X6S1_DIALT|nr:hypothetical protein KFE25_004399 [Diacronema lutheri]
MAGIMRLFASDGHSYGVDTSPVGLLGHGGQGVVRIAHREADGALFAVKIVPPHPSTGASELALEAAALRQVAGHASVVRLEAHALREDDEPSFIVLELCTGGELFDEVLTAADARRRGRAPPARSACDGDDVGAAEPSSGGLSHAQARVYLEQLLSALAHCHARGVYHRDVKAENVLLDADGHVKLVDFGLARVDARRAGAAGGAAAGVDALAADDELLSRTQCGSVMYAAPELLLCSPSRPADGASVGCQRSVGGGGGAGGAGGPAAATPLAAPRSDASAATASVRASASALMLATHVPLGGGTASRGGDAAACARTGAQAAADAPCAQYAPGKADVWSCGVVFYAMLTGMLPFACAHVGTCARYAAFVGARAAADGTPQQLSALPRVVSDVLLRMLEPSPSARESAASLLRHPWLRGGIWVDVAHVPMALVAPSPAPTPAPTPAPALPTGAQLAAPTAVAGAGASADGVAPGAHATSAPGPTPSLKRRHGAFVSDNDLVTLFACAGGSSSEPPSPRAPPSPPPPHVRRASVGSNADAASLSDAYASHSGAHSARCAPCAAPPPSSPHSAANSPMPHALSFSGGAHRKAARHGAASGPGGVAADEATDGGVAGAGGGGRARVD